MPEGRHRAPDHGPSNPVHRDSGGIALAVLALLGLAGPAWILRGQAADLLSAEWPTALSVPDVTEPTP
ncbi:hypothetical protein AF335_18255 [Streptomyces eurocidicus]|uniref:Uncharacterized protein n=1 Tax=Streptomyces eurocidicus TaxID=66423 RepID=A0A2N8NUR7_STREU|nr:hypothetical protein [Streptomyces eurocidicus]MBB5121283.1 hypothetical protein [Streptomyces eurocidicus]MBF6055893.1 hypothetical protein [Streptomyces eurocidicus]PNE32511.1 hypothetical protein AF335_18255 [Streptomyces eurocidicus]